MEAPSKSRAQYFREYKQTNRARLNEYWRVYSSHQRSLDPGKYARYQKAYKEAHRAKVQAYNRAYYLKRKHQASLATPPPQST